MRTDNRVLYFSLNPQSVEAFYTCLDNTRLDSQCSFRAIEREKVFDKDNGNCLRFKHASDLLYFLDSFGEENDLGYLFVIIDYPSFFNPAKHSSFMELGRSNELESFSVKDAAKIIRRSILQYPEVFFMFDESWNPSDESPWYLHFLFGFNETRYTEGVWADYHKYAVRSGDNPFDAIVRGRTSMFDSSNLRYAIKRYEYNVLHVERYNFSLVQDSRAENLAVCIEEERSQNRFNSYVLYSCGYRVLSVFSSKELKEINSKAGELKPTLIVRDYDLQFPDVEDTITRIEIQDKESYKIHTIDYIRGAKYLTKLDNEWNKNHTTTEQLNDDDAIYSNKWIVPCSDSNPNSYWKSSNIFWDGLLSVKGIKVFFVSKGVGDRIRFYPSTAEYQRKRNRALRNKKTETDSLGLFVDGVSQQVMRGTSKPVSGIYTAFRQFETIKKTYDSFRIENKRHFRKSHTILKEKNLKIIEEKIKCQAEIVACSQEEVKRLSAECDGGMSNSIREAIDKANVSARNAMAEMAHLAEERSQVKRMQEWYIDTSRENHEHGVPLDVYDTVRNMLERAQRYYNSGKYIRSAIISSEVIEVLNGFHEALMLQAYHILAISENAIAMNTIGGNEEDLSLDANFRISKIASEVERLMDRKGEDRRKLKYNILNQIFSECRAFCQNKEHFEAENHFISAMAHVNEGYDYDDIFNDISNKVKKWMTNIRLFIHTVGHVEENM